MSVCVAAPIPLIETPVGLTPRTVDWMPEMAVSARAPRGVALIADDVPAAGSLAVAPKPPDGVRPSVCRAVLARFATLAARPPEGVRPREWLAIEDVTESNEPIVVCRVDVWRLFPSFTTLLMEPCAKTSWVAPGELM
jgi:hypothetical protein